jgi:hypothetical protein
MIKALTFHDATRRRSSAMNTFSKTALRQTDRALLQVLARTEVRVHPLGNPSGDSFAEHLGRIER